MESILVICVSPVVSLFYHLSKKSYFWEFSWGDSPKYEKDSMYLLEKARATHSSTLAWKIPWTEEPGGLQSMGSLGVGHD